MEQTTKSSRVGMWSLIILIAEMFLLPFLIMFVMPVSLFNDKSMVSAGLILSSVLAVTALICGVLMGLKIEKRKDLVMNATAVALFTFIFVHLAIVSSSSIGLQSIIQYILILVLPIAIGSFLGALKKRRL